MHNFYFLSLVPFLLLSIHTRAIRAKQNFNLVACAKLFVSRHLFHRITLPGCILVNKQSYLFIYPVFFLFLGKPKLQCNRNDISLAEGRSTLDLFVQPSTEHAFRHAFASSGWSSRPLQIDAIAHSWALST